METLNENIKYEPKLETTDARPEGYATISIDGAYFGLFIKKMKRLGLAFNWSVFFDFLKNMIEIEYGIRIQKLDIHIYIGSSPIPNRELEAFLNEAESAGCIVHRLPLKCIGCSGNGMRYKEDGVDQLFALESMQRMCINCDPTIPTKIRILGLITGDSDHIPLVQTIQKFGATVILLYDGDLIKKCTSQALVDMSDIAIPLNALPYDMGNSCARKVFTPIVKNIVEKGTILFSTSSYSIITAGASGDYLYRHPADNTITAADAGKKVEFTVVRPAKHNDGSQCYYETNGIAANVKLLDASSADSSSLEPSCEQLKEFMEQCPSREDDFVLLADLGNVLRNSGFSTHRSLKDILEQYSNVFELAARPASCVRIRQAA